MNIQQEGVMLYKQDDRCPIRDCPGTLNVVTEPRLENFNGHMEWRNKKIVSCNQAACPYFESLDLGPAAGPFTEAV